MPPVTNDQCEHCHTNYTLVKRKVKTMTPKEKANKIVFFCRKIAQYVDNRIVQIVHHVNVIIILRIVYVLFVN